MGANIQDQFKTTFVLCNKNFSCFIVCALDDTIFVLKERTYNNLPPTSLLREFLGAARSIIKGFIFRR